MHGPSLNRCTITIALTALLMLPLRALHADEQSDGFFERGSATGFFENNTVGVTSAQKSAGKSKEEALDLKKLEEDFTAKIAEQYKLQPGSFDAAKAANPRGAAPVDAEEGNQAGSQE